MQWALTALSLVALAPAAARGQVTPAELDDPSGAPVEAPDREGIEPLTVSVETMTLEDRHVDTLAGTWAGVGLGVAAGALLGLAIGLPVGCALASDVAVGCLLGGVVGPFHGALLGLLIGTGVGVGLGAGISFGEGLAALGLGLLAGAAAMSISLALGYAVGEDAWGGAIGYAMGGLGIIFVTSAVGASIAHRNDASAPSRALRWTPTLSPSPDGLAFGVAGAF